MRFATWNINSVRTRVDRAIEVLKRHDLDVLALQEIKCKPEQFPFEAFEQAGYEVALVGYNQWNGVAIVSRVGLEDVELHFPDQPTFAKEGDPVVEARAIGATCGGVRIWSLYIPNGRTLEDPHYDYKLLWLKQLRDIAEQWLSNDPNVDLALVGDWNVAPLDTDVWDLAAFEGATHVSPPEREAFEAFAGIGFTEISRKFIPEEGKYTYWDYQKLRFPKNEGMRIDFAYTSPHLTERVTSVIIDRDERKGKGASDHVPVIVEIS